MYFMITPTEDGADIAGPLSEQALLGTINGGTTFRFLDEIPENNPAYWAGNDALVIKGEIVVPTPREVVTEYGVE